VSRQLFVSQKVAANPQDKWVLVMGNRIIVITNDGSVFAHDVDGDNVSTAFEFISDQKVAANQEDKRVLVMENRIFVITRQRWFYYAGMQSNDQPIWKDDEADALPLPPFGSPLKPEGFHECLGYFSVRFIEGWKKWVMLYTCDGIVNGENNKNARRGIYMRTANLPWGQWSHPFFVFDPGSAYGRFMHFQPSDENNQGNSNGTNPAEESVRDISPPWQHGVPTKRASGGEYAPLLLPSRHQKADTESANLYFLMSTWNPYQVVLMRLEIGIA